MFFSVFKVAAKKMDVNLKKITYEQQLQGLKGLSLIYDEAKKIWFFINRP